MRSLLFRVLPICTLAILAFGAGIAVHKHKPFPYEPAVKWLKNLLSQKARYNRDPDAVKSSQYSQISGEASFTREIDTALLPLQARGIKLNGIYDFPKSGGGIAVVGDLLVIADWMGGLYLLENGKVKKCKFPNIPNNVDELIKHSPPLTRGFRVHDIEYIKSERALAISHEAYDRAHSSTYLAVSVISINEQTLNPTSDWRTIYRGDILKSIRYSGIAGGGRLLVKAADKLLLTTGDYNQDNVMEASQKVSQDPISSLGKIVEIDLRADKFRVVSLGHRNPQGLMVTRSGDLYSTEHGPAGGDELNHVVEGSNYGWPDVTLGTDYGTYDWPNQQFAGEHLGFNIPIFAWVPSIGVSNIIQIENFNRRWDGDFLVASLKASTLYRLRMNNGRVVYSEPIWIGDRIRDLAQFVDGTIVLWTDDSKLLLLRPNQDKLAANKRALDINAPPIMASCMSCHHLGPTDPTHLAPTLTGLMGRRVASDDFAKYSPGLSKLGGLWTRDRLTAYLANPESIASGTSMPKLDISADQIDRIVQFLETEVAGR